MRWKLNKRLLILTAWCAALLWVSCKNETNDSVHNNHFTQEGAYSCPMLCEGNKSYPEPGNCPVCNMKLQWMDDVLLQAESPAQVVISRQATVKPESAGETQTIRVQGHIDYDRNRNQSVSARFGGRIEKIYVKYDLQYVRKGDQILEIYSPELNTIREQHLLMLKTNASKELLEQSREKMKLLGITGAQIAELEKNNVITPTVTIFSPANGYVLFNTEEQSAPNKTGTSQGGMDGMSSATTMATAGSGSSQIREGMYVNAGETWFSINDLQTVWAILSVPDAHLASVKPGASIRLTAEWHSGKTLEGKVLLTEQTFEDSRQRFVRIRVGLQNPNAELKINSLVTADWPVAQAAGLQVPATAVFFTGMNAVVWVKTGTTASGSGIFKLRNVVAGGVHNGSADIISGLTPDEEIALNAGAMADSETFLNAK